MVIDLCRTQVPVAGCWRVWESRGLYLECRPASAAIATGLFGTSDTIV
jgi:hypothetical protein